MSEKAKTITLDELIQYAHEVKDQKEKERLNTIAKKEQECFKLIQSIILALRDEQEVIVAPRGLGTFAVNRTGVQASVTITLEDIKEVIDKIPDLASDWTEDKDNNDNDSRALKVWLSETKSTDIPVTEELRSKIAEITSKA